MGEKVENLREQNFRLQARVAALDYVVKAQRDVMDRMALLIPDFQNMPKPENFDYVPDPVDYTKSLTPEPDFLSEEPFTDDLGKILESMMQIYGEEMGKEILAMELAMQNRFEQKCDEFKAKLWPSLPLNLSFNNGPVSL